MTFRAWAVLSLLACLPASLAAAHDATPFQEGGRGHVLYEDAGPAGVEPINIETYVPAACAAKPCPLVISIHGMTRNAESARDSWVNAADRYGLLIAAPHFDKDRFPARLFQQGGVRNQPDQSKWTYGIIERFFDRALQTGRVAGTSYVLFGHSAGGQFVHRMVMLVPNARYATAISANAGYYTLPTWKEGADGASYPYSLAGTPVTPADLKGAFARRLIVMLGDRDTDPDHPQLNKARRAEAQGPDRFARGQNFMAVARAEASRLGAELAWREITVPGAAHQQRKMAHAAAELLFGPK
jgi:poly(3-hydroxybutyrate) depolymerase